jgi:hypothetical protein
MRSFCIKKYFSQDAGSIIIIPGIEFVQPL